MGKRTVEETSLVAVADTIREKTGTIDKLVFPEGFKRKEHGICQRTMKNFEERFPEVAKEYFDLRYEDVKRYKVR